MCPFSHRLRDIYIQYPQLITLPLNICDECLLLTVADIVLSKKVCVLLWYLHCKSEFFLPYQQRLRDGIVELDHSANQMRQNRSQAENEIRQKMSSLMRCKER